MRRFPGQTFPLFSSFSLPARGFALILTITLAAPFLLASCASPSGGTSGTGQAPTDTATATPIPQCVQLSPGATPFTGIAGVSGLTLPAGAYITAPIDSGGGDGEYRIATYTVCFQGAATAISGASAGATFTQLQAAGWTFDNLFPDPTNFSYIDYCSNSHNCFNTSGTSNPFAFIGFQHYATPATGYTTFTLQVATIAAPSCVNDPTY